VPLAVTLNVAGLGAVTTTACGCWVMVGAPGPTAFPDTVSFAGALTTQSVGVIADCSQVEGRVKQARAWKSAPLSWDCTGGVVKVLSRTRNPVCSPVSDQRWGSSGICIW